MIPDLSYKVFFGKTWKGFGNNVCIGWLVVELSYVGLRGKVRECINSCNIS